MSTRRSRRSTDTTSKAPRTATKQLGYHPLVATRAGTGEILHARMRKGSAGSARGVVRFIDELIASIRRAGLDGQITLRADSGLWSWKLVDALNKRQRTVRLVVRRTRLCGRQAQLFPDWRHHAFITNTEHDTVTADAFHRNHAVVELAIRDLKEGAGLEHCPSGNNSANAAWLACAVLAHNLSRWTTHLGDTRPDRRTWNHATIRTRLIALAATLVNRSGRPTLRLPLHWPWAKQFTTMLNTLRALPAPSG